MKHLILILLFTFSVFAETVGPVAVKSKTFNGDGTQGIGSILDALKVNLTNTTLPVTGTFWQSTQPVSIAAPVAVTGNFYQTTQPVSISATVPVSGPFLTDAQLRASLIPVVGPLTDTQLRLSPLAVTTGGLTNAELRSAPLSVTVTGAGDATAANQVIANNNLINIASKLPNALTVTANRLLVDGSGVVQPVQGNVTITNPSIAVTGSFLTDAQLRATPLTINLPSGSATSAKQDTGNTSLAAIDAKLGSPLTVAVNNLPATQAVTASSLPLPSGASTSALQTSGNTSLTSIDGKIPSGLTVASGKLQVELPAGSQGLTDTQLRATAVPVSLSSAPLATGASTSALQTSGNSSLTSIDAKTPALGQALAAASTPVVLPAAQISAIAPPADHSTDALQVITNSALGDITSNTNVAASYSQQNNTLLNSIYEDMAYGQDIINLGNKFTNNVSGTLKVDGSTVTQPVSATALPLPTGAATEATLSALNTKTPALGQALDTGSVPVVLTASQVSALAPLSTQPISATALPLPNMAATDQLQVIGNSSLGDITANTNAIANLVSQVRTEIINLDNDLNGTPAVQVSSSVLPTGSSTSALQTSGNASLTSIDGKIPAGLTVTTGRLQVELPAGSATSGLTDTQLRATPVPVSNASLPLPTGAATETTLSALNSKVTAVNTGAVTVAASALPTGAATSSAQASLQTTLSSIDTKTPALGQALAAGSTPVVLTAAQLATLTPLTTVNVGNFPSSQAVTGAFFQATQPVSIASSVAVTGPLTDTQLRATAVPVSLASTTITNFPATQAVSAASLPLPTGASTSALQTSGNTSLTSIDSKLTSGLALDATQTNGTAKSIVRGGAKGTTTAADVTSTAVDANTQGLDVSVKGTVTTSVSNFPATQAISAASLPLPTGAATETTLSALNTKVTTTANGIKVDGSATTQPVSGTVTSNIGTTNGLALDATLTGGSQKSLIRGTAKGTTTAGDVTSTNVDANTQAMDVAVKGTVATTLSGTPSVSVSNFPATQAVSGTVTANIGTTNGLALDSTVAKDASLTTLNTSVNTLLKPASTLAAVTAITNAVTIKADTAVNQTNALKVDGSAVTQPVSIAGTITTTGGLTDTQLRASAVQVSNASLPLPAGASTSAKQPALGIAGTPSADVLTVQGTATMTALKVDGSATTQPVSIAGTVTTTGGLTDTQLRASAVPVTANAGTGTFQTNITNASLPVTGTFFQATQPVSGTVNANTGLAQPLTDTQLRATAVPVSGTVTANATLTAGSAIVGKVGIDQTTPGTTNLVSIGTNGTVAINAALPTGANTIGTVNAPAITKGTQGTTGFTTQDLKDSGRVIKTFTATFTGATTEALITLVPTSDGVAAAGATSFAVTAGKRLRIQSITVTTRNAAAAQQGVVVNLRYINTGAVTATSNLAYTASAGTATAIANITAGQAVDIADGFELSGTMQFGVSQVGTATAGNTVTVIGYEY